MLNRLASSQRFMQRRSANLKLNPKIFINALLASALSGYHSLRQGITHSKAHLDLQNWTVMITNLDESVASDEQICELYRLRWRIENVFKVAKSETKLKRLLDHRSNPQHIDCLPKVCACIDRDQNFGWQGERKAGSELPN